jgi:hypothetical protein
MNHAGRRLFFCSLRGLQSDFSTTVNHSGNLHIRPFAEAPARFSAINNNAFRPRSCKVLPAGISSSSSCLFLFILYILRFRFLNTLTHTVMPFSCLVKETVDTLLQMEPLCGRKALLVQVAWLLFVSVVCSSPVTWQRANASGGLFDGMSPEDHGLRPANPLDELPPPDLIESPNKMLDPTPLDLNVTALRAMLGRNFDPQFMSIARPRYEGSIFLHPSYLP